MKNQHYPSHHNLSLDVLIFLAASMIGPLKVNAEIPMGGSQSQPEKQQQQQPQEHSQSKVDNFFNATDFDQDNQNYENMKMNHGKMKTDQSDKIMKKDSRTARGNKYQNRQELDKLSKQQNLPQDEPKADLPDLRPITPSTNRPGGESNGEH